MGVKFKQRLILTTVFVMVISSCESQQTIETDIDFSDDDYLFQKIDLGYTSVSVLLVNAEDKNEAFALGSAQNDGGSDMELQMFIVDTENRIMKPYNQLMQHDTHHRLRNIFFRPDGAMWMLIYDSINDVYVLRSSSLHSDIEVEISMADYFGTYIEIINISGVYENYYYKVIGSTEEGHVVVWTPDKVFTIDYDGAVSRSWVISSNIENRHATQVCIAGNDIFYLDSPLLDMDSGGARISKLNQDGSIELLHQLETKHSNMFVDADKGIYLYNYNDPQKELFKLSENGNLEALFSILDIMPLGNQMQEMIIFENGTYLLRIGYEVFYVTK